MATLLRFHRLATLPPGDGHDPATYGVDALAILDGERPIFLETNFGREALFSYIVALCFAVLGAGTLGIHAASAVVGVLTVPAVFLLAEELFYTEKESSLRKLGGPVAALMVALSYWHLNWSRYGVRAILVPLFAALGAAFLWRGLRTGRRCSFVACGACLGLGMYTYQAARLLPLLVLTGFGLLAWPRRAIGKRDVANAAITFGVAALVFAPLGCYFVRHPGSFGQRIDQALVVEGSQQAAANARAVLGQAVDTLLMFNIRGDSEPYCTIPGRPALNPFLSLAMWAGIAVCLRRVKQPRYLFLLIWLALLSVPAMLAGLGPAAKRAIGTLPAVALLVSLGLLVPCDALRHWLRDRSPARAKTVMTAFVMTTFVMTTFAVLICAGFLYTGARTYCDYFVTWASDPNLFTHFEAGLSAIGAYARELPPEEQIYLSPPPPEHPSIVLHADRRPGITGYNGRVCLVVPVRPRRDTTYIVVPSQDQHSLDLLAAVLPQGTIAGYGPPHYGLPWFLAYRVPAGAEAALDPTHTDGINWEGRIELWGYDLETRARAPGETLALTLYYRRLRAMERDYTAFVQLWGPHNPATGGPVWAQDDSEPCRRGYPTSRWEEGEVLLDRLRLEIPTDAPAGPYTLAMGFYQWPSLERLTALDATGVVLGDHAVLATLEIVAP